MLKSKDMQMAGVYTQPGIAQGLAEFPTFYSYH